MGILDILKRKRGRHYFDDAYNIYSNSVSAAAENKFNLALWSAWSNGAIFLEGGLPSIPGFEALPDSLGKAKNLVNLFVQPMISIWFHNWESQEEHTVEEKDSARRIAFQNVQSFLHIDFPKVIDLHIELDREFRQFLDKEVVSSAYYVGMFHQRYRECVGGASIVDWDRVQYPIVSWEEFLNYCDKTKYKDLDGLSSVVAFSLIADAGVRMFQEFSQMYERE